MQYLVANLPGITGCEMVITIAVIIVGPDLYIICNRYRSVVNQLIKIVIRFGSV